MGRGGGLGEVCPNGASQGNVAGLLHEGLTQAGGTEEVHELGPRGQSQLRVHLAHLSHARGGVLLPELGEDEVGLRSSSNPSPSFQRNEIVPGGRVDHILPEWGAIDGTGDAVVHGIDHHAGPFHGPLGHQGG